jgi:adenosine deaminase
MGFKSAFLPYAIKRAMLSEVVNELKSFTPGSLDSKKEQL